MATQDARLGVDPGLSHRERVTRAYARARKITGHSPAEYGILLAAEAGYTPAQIREFRELHELTKVGDAVTMTEAGKYDPPAYVLLAAARVAGVPVSLLCEEPTTYEFVMELKARVEALERERR